MGSSKKPKPVIVSYWYKAGMHYVPCYGPVDALTEVRVSDRSAWSGSQTTSGSITISQENLFGGKSREGGVKGTLRVKMGETTQDNSGFSGSGVIPAYRGVLSLVYRGIYSAGNPYMKPWWFKVRRILKGWHNDSVWYSAKATVTLGGVAHMNPAHIIYECITNPEWGMGYPTSAIDDAAFTSAADTLYTEGFGMSITWNQQGQIKGFIGEVLDHIHAVLRNDPSTGKFVLKLIREDYDFDELDIYDEAQIVDVTEYQRASWGETINEITVRYTDQSTSRVSAVTVHELANVQAQGGVISKTATYSGIPTYDLAVKVAMRDLRMASNPLAKVRFTVNRMGWRLLPGDVFRMQFSKLGIADVIFRVMDVNIGSLEANTITVSAIEDIFGLPTAAYVAQEPVGWVDPTSEPADSPFVYPTETHYWGLTRVMSRADLDYLEADDCYLTVMSQQPSGDSLSYSLWTRISPDDYATSGGSAHCPIAELTASVSKTDTVISYDPDTAENIGVVEAGTYAYIQNSGTRYEMVQIVSVSDTTITVVRGILDTVPVEHDAGDLILFAEDFESTDGNLYLPTEAVNVKIQTKTGLGELDLADATQHSYTFAQRQNLPYPPGLFRINASQYPATYTGATAAVTWAHRDRLQQTATIIDQDEASIGPEAGTTYNLRLYNAASALMQEETGVTGTSHTFNVSEARYFRIKACTVATGGANLTISELRLYNGGSPVDAGATVTSSSAPAAGALANLYDGNTATTASWTKATAEGAGFWIKWDAGVGNTMVVSAIRIGGATDSQEYFNGLTIQQSHDNATWVDVHAVSGLAYPGNSTLSGDIDVRPATVTVQLESERDTLTSWHYHEHTMARA